MKFSEDIADIVRHSPLPEQVDKEVLDNFDPDKFLVRLETSAQYKTLTESFLGMYERALNNNVPMIKAVALILGTHEDLIRFSIEKSLKEWAASLKIDDAIDNNPAIQAIDFSNKLKEAREAMQLLDQEYKHRAAGHTVQQFRAYLLYAADKWGNQSEKKAINSLVKKIQP